MLQRVINFALEQRTFIIAVVIAVMIGGGYALSNLPIEAFPDVQDVQVQIITQASGLAPEEIERSISLPIEREMSGVPHMTQQRSVSIFGLSVVTLTFEDNTDDYFARQQVLEKLQNVTLPTGIQPSLAPLTTAVGEIYRYILTAPADTSLEKIREMQDWVVRPALRTIAGVADVASFGGAVKEYQVTIDPQMMRKYSVTFDQINTALSNGSANTGGGILRRGDEALVVRSIGLFQSIQDIERVAVSSQDGSSVRISDVATVSVGHRPRSGIVSFNDKDDVVEGIVQMTKAQNPSAVIARLKASIPAIEKRLPEGYHLTPIYDRTNLVNHTVRTVEENMLIGAFLVVLILIVFLRSAIAAIIVAAVIPIALLFAFLFIYIRGVSANLISLGSVDFGIIVDGAVVLVEALMVRLALEKTSGHPSHDTPRWRMNALRSTSVEMGHPILFAKAIIILAFLPIFTFQRVEGKIFSPMTYTLSFAILGAILLTLTLIPALLSYAINRFDLSEKHSPWMEYLQNLYRSFLVKIGKDDKRWIGISVGILAFSILLGTRLGTEFLPKLDEGNIWLSIDLPQATNLEKSRELEQTIRGILRSYPEVTQVISHVGRPDDGTDPKGPNNMEILADLSPSKEWRFASKEDLIADMTAKIHRIPGVPTNFSQVIEDNVEESISGVKGEIAIKLYGPDLDILEDKSRHLAELISGVRGAADVEAIKVGGQTELDIDIDREKIARYGVDIASVNAAIQTALAGASVNTFYEGDRQFAVSVRLREESRDAVDDIAEIPIAIPGGSATLPLGEIAAITVKQGAARIGRENGERNVSVKANLIGRDQGSFVKEAMQVVASKLHLPSGYTITWGGQFENQQRAMHRLAVIVPLSIVGIFVLLFVAFRSMRLAVLVLALIPFTWVGGLAGLALTGLHLSISAAVGFIAVAGISVQNGVIMIEQIVDGIKQGKQINVAVLDGAIVRLRPILMTALMAWDPLESTCRHASLSIL